MSGSSGCFQPCIYVILYSYHWVQSLVKSFIQISFFPKPCPVQKHLTKQTKDWPLSLPCAVWFHFCLATEAAFLDIFTSIYFCFIHWSMLHRDRSTHTSQVTSLSGKATVCRWLAQAASAQGHLCGGEARSPREFLRSPWLSIHVQDRVHVCSEACVGMTAWQP